VSLAPLDKWRLKDSCQWQRKRKGRFEQRKWEFATLLGTEGGAQCLGVQFIADYLRHTLLMTDCVTCTTSPQKRAINGSSVAGAVHRSQAARPAAPCHRRGSSAACCAPPSLPRGCGSAWVF
jgi:hypothetical protein